MAKLDPEYLLSAFDRIKFGSGVVGKVTASLVALFGLLSVITWGLSGNVQALLAVAGVAVLLFLFFAVGVALYAIKFPNLAALEGAELVSWRKTDMAASDPKLINAAANTLPPASPSDGGQ